MAKTLVIKVGGTLLQAPETAKRLFRVIAQLQRSHLVVLVHGGGELAQQWLSAMGMQSVKHQGLRVTPTEQLPVVVGALAGSANKTLLAWASSTGLAAVGLSLADANLCDCTQLDPQLGAVGSAKPKDARLLTALLAQTYLPIISSIGADTDGNLLNVNADQAAITISALIGAELVLLSDVPGVLDADKQLIPQLNAESIAELSAAGVITDGMLVKVNAALAAAEHLNKPVTIASWQQPEALLQDSQNAAGGTQIFPDPLTTGVSLS